MLRLVLICVSMLFSISAFADVENIKLDCSGKTEISTTEIGPVGKTTPRTEKGIPSDVILTINNNICLWDGDDYKHEYELISSDETSVVCKMFVSNTTESTGVTTKKSWMITINRFNGQMIMNYVFDNNNNKTYKVYKNTKQIFKCKKANKLF